ncbi:hotdog fold thioesterase [candidate division GN15 bacterium]|nr:hotdog fold thioesterase [candidate division GN15 bacterium]
MDSELLKYSGCFVCGDQNPIGLKARFFFDGSQAYTDVVADKRFEGYSRIYHGGIISTLLDEVMIKAVLANEVYVVTAEMTVKFLRPVKVGDKLHFRGWVTRQRGRIWLTEGVAEDAEGQAYASATGKYVEASGDLRQALMQSVE